MASVSRCLAVALLAALFPLPARDASTAGFPLENVEIVPVDPAATWRALVDEVELWWPADHTWRGDASKLSIRPVANG